MATLAAVTPNPILADLTPQTIENKAREYQFYNSSKEAWCSLGTFERVVRAILSQVGIMMTSERACLYYSWRSISQLREVPPNLQSAIDQIFVDSRSSDHPLNVASSSITAIYRKSLPKDSAYSIQMDPRLRAFHVLDHQEEHLGTVVSSAYGQLDFYDANNQLTHVNTFDTLSETTSQPRKWSVFLASDHASFLARIFRSLTQIQLFSDATHPLMIVSAEGDSQSFVFRDVQNSNKMLAIASWHQGPEWSVSVLPDAKVERHLLTWLLMKHTQKFLPNPHEERPYLSDFSSLRRHHVYRLLHT